MSTKGLTAHITELMHIQGYKAAEIKEHLGVSLSRVYQILSHTNEYKDISDNPRWYLARALIGRAESREEMSRIWEEYRDIWTVELTEYGEEVLRVPAPYQYGRTNRWQRIHSYEELMVAHSQGRLIHAWSVEAR